MGVVSHLPAAADPTASACNKHRTPGRRKRRRRAPHSGLGRVPREWKDRTFCSRKQQCERINVKRNHSCR